MRRGERKLPRFAVGKRRIRELDRLGFASSEPLFQLPNRVVSGRREAAQTWFPLDRNRMRGDHEQLRVDRRDRLLDVPIGEFASLRLGRFRELWPFVGVRPSESWRLQIA